MFVEVGLQFALAYYFWRSFGTWKDDPSGFVLYGIRIKIESSGSL